MNLLRAQLFLFALYLISIASCIYPCKSAEPDTDSNAKYIKIINKADALIKADSLEQARSILLQALESARKNAITAPYVKDNTLIFYSNSQEQTISCMMTAAAYTVLKDSSEHNKSLIDLKLDSIWNISPWTNSSARYDPVSNIYFYLAVIAEKEHQYYTAIKYLDTTTTIHPGYGSAWGEMVFAYSSNGFLAKAKEIAEKALRIPDIEFDQYGKSIIYRQLGLISMEEHNIDKVIEYFKLSVESYDNPNVKKELDDILKLKQKHN